MMANILRGGTTDSFIPYGSILLYTSDRLLHIVSFDLFEMLSDLNSFISLFIFSISIIFFSA